MKKKAIAFSLVLTCAMFVLGLVLIFTAPARGQSAGHREIMRHGGSMDTHQFERVITTNTTAFTVGGAVIASVGGLGMLVCGGIVLRKYGG